MNSHPMIFNADMIRAILEGKKTVTRRPLNPQPISSLEGYMWWPKGTLKREAILDPKIHGGDWNQFISDICPLASVDSAIWTRETLTFEEDMNLYYDMDNLPVDRDTNPDWYYRNPNFIGKVPSIHMPRHCSRLTLLVTSIKLERVQDITEKQAIAEGFTPQKDSTAREQFASLWESLYANWDVNPYVWTIEFKTFQTNIDTYIAEEKSREAAYG